MIRITFKNKCICDYLTLIDVDGDEINLVNTDYEVILQWLSNIEKIEKQVKDLTVDELNNMFYKTECQKQYKFITVWKNAIGSRINLDYYIDVTDLYKNGE